MIALAPLGFKLATETINNVGKGMLYDLSPGAVRSIVAEQQGAFKKIIQNEPYRSRARALQVVQAYLAICLPASIEMQVEDAVTKVKFREKVEPAGPPATATVTQPAVNNPQSNPGAQASPGKPDQPQASGQQTPVQRPPDDGKVPVIEPYQG